MKMKVTQPIGERVRELRKAQGLPALVLARKAGISQQTLWLLERWNIVPDSRRACEAIARVLGVSVEELFQECDVP